MHGIRSEALRAYLLVASVAALVIDLIALYAGWVLQIPESVFVSTPFRVLASLMIIAAVAAVRLRCGMAANSIGTNVRAAFACDPRSEPGFSPRPIAQDL